MQGFRPLLGFFIFQSPKGIIVCNSDRLVSVPYWGSLYFNKTKVIMMLSMVDQRFRPLLGFFIFQSTMRDLIEILKAFPSPIGVLYISIMQETQQTSIVRIVSVPYWGSLYFNYKEYEELKKRFFEKFPSPIGVLYISIILLFISNQRGCKFPSPIGVLYISMRCKYMRDFIELLFPSPIGVLYISILDNSNNSNCISVSVPYWGSLYFNYLTMLTTSFM